MKNIFGNIFLLCITLSLACATPSKTIINYGSENYTNESGSWDPQKPRYNNVDGWLSGEVDTTSGDSIFFANNNDGAGDEDYSSTGFFTGIDAQTLNLGWQDDILEAGKTTKLHGGQHVIDHRKTSDRYFLSARHPSGFNFDPLGNTKHRRNDTKPDAYQVRMNENHVVVNNGYTVHYGLAFTPHVKKSDFLSDGSSSLEKVAFSDSDTSFHAGVDISDNFTARAIVQHNDSWYVSKTSTTSSALTFNAYKDDWYAYDPGDSLFSNTDGVATVAKGSFFDDIQAVGVLIENYSVETDSAGARSHSLQSLVIDGTLTTVPEMNSFAICLPAILFIYMVSRRRRIVL